MCRPSAVIASEIHVPRTWMQSCFVRVTAILTQDKVMIVTALWGDTWKGVSHFLKPNYLLNTCTNWKCTVSRDSSKENDLISESLLPRTIWVLPTQWIILPSSWILHHLLLKNQDCFESPCYLTLSSKQMAPDSENLFTCWSKTCYFAVLSLDSCQSTQSLCWSIWSLKFKIFLLICLSGFQEYL